MKSKKLKPVTLQIYMPKLLIILICSKPSQTNLMLELMLIISNFIHLVNAEINMAVKTTSGLTDRQVLKDVFLQGDTGGSMLASMGTCVASLAWSRHA
jgi:hypothetical protein